jgi:DNA-binding NarL/FixJ family response regulator
MNTYTILFVDDEPGLSIPLRLTLEARGFVCITKTDVTEAWRFLESNPVDVVVTDIMMPAGEDFPEVDSSSAGFFFVRKLREKLPRMAIICLSVIADVKKIEDLKRQNIQYLRKGETPLDKAAKLIESKATGKMSF